MKKPGKASSSEELANRVVEIGKEKGLTVATAESITGGLIGSYITSVPGSSDVFLGGVLSYANSAKEQVLQVSESSLMSFGAVSEQVAKEMAEGARNAQNAEVAVSVTGIAGPGGAVPGKPIGTVWIGVSTSSETKAQCHLFKGSRAEIREATASEALKALIDAM